MDEQPTCGKGLAENAGLPAKLAQLTDALAEVLELHTRALDLGDIKARREYDVYRKLSREHRDTAAALRATAHEMAGQRSLPMGRHETRTLTDHQAVEALETFVKLERELRALLDERIDRDQGMLDTMRRPAV